MIHIQSHIENMFYLKMTGLVKKIQRAWTIKREFW